MLIEPRPRKKGSPTPESAGAIDLEGVTSVRRLLRSGGLAMLMQPIVDLGTGVLHGHEAFVRGPARSPLHLPDALFAAARAEGCEPDLEFACIDLAVELARSPAVSERLFLNLSARGVVELVARIGRGDPPPWQRPGVDKSGAAIVIEVTEHEQVRAFEPLLEAVAELRRTGVRIALDDFGDGRSSLRLWSELRPDYVKIDKYFARHIGANADKLATYRALMQIAEVFSSQIVAEGIESDEDLVVIRDLGVQLGQGYFVARPAAADAAVIRPEAVEVIRARRIAVFPERRLQQTSSGTVDRIARPAVPVAPSVVNDDLYVRFCRDESIANVAIVDRGRPVGLINRQAFMDRYAKPYYREVFGRKPCTLFANLQPLVLDRHTPLDELTQVLTSDDQRYLSDGFIVTEEGRYFALGTGDQLVRTVTEMRVEAARHANPLTLLPGNIPTSAHIARLLASRVEFVAAYCDLDHFKPFNDRYGYWRGDEMIRLAARMIAAHCDPRCDFVGHPGGDDFMVLFQSSDWLERCQAIVDEFDQQAAALYDEDARTAGGIEGEDRYGVRRFFPCTRMSIGAVLGTSGRFTNPEAVATSAAAAKHAAKTGRLRIHLAN